MSDRGSSIVLETYDPQWQTKWDRAHKMMHELEAREWSSLAVDDRDRLDGLRRLLPVIFDARHRTANHYIRFHLSLTLKEADDLNIWAWLPVLPDDADIDTTRAVVSAVVSYIETVKHRREIFVACRRAGVRPQYIRSLPKLTWGTRWAMLCFRLGRLHRRYKGYRFVRAMDA